MGKFEGNIALIIGDNGGIGLATAKQRDRSHSSSCADRSSCPASGPVSHKELVEASLARLEVMAIIPSP